MRRHQEILTIVDSKSWIWTFIQRSILRLNKLPVRIPASYSLHDSWHRVQKAPFIIIHWECKERSGGAIIEEILSICPSYDTRRKLIVLITNPTHEDIIYLSELNITNVISLQNIPSFLKKAEKELSHFLERPLPPKEGEIGYKHSIQMLTQLPEHSDPAQIKALHANLEHALTHSERSLSATTLDLQANVAFLKQQPENAQKLWQQAIEKNPNYFRAYNNLIHFFRLTQRYEEAFILMKKLQHLNKSNISRLVAMGELQVFLHNDDHALHYFQSALERDQYCSGALNGMAEIYFRRGDLEKSRHFLSRSYIAASLATKLNMEGIKLVKQGKYEQALEHYLKAQYVLPQQEKSPLLFYNIGLCYSRWGKHESAMKFLEIALIKEPNYDKAKKLLLAIKHAQKAKHQASGSP